MRRIVKGEVYQVQAYDTEHNCPVFGVRKVKRTLAQWNEPADLRPWKENIDTLLFAALSKFYDREVRITIETVGKKETPAEGRARHRWLKARGIK